ncbi:YfhO family protein [Sporolactobacillus shoreicorticis]|uniref:YfhO family protein n=1 Tax=Sporolactobacillus shoreicorticis TaxID=1923877 RepID=A0ABW5S7J5_9BACL|nr:YfhO family protein [Sporolactobacillus shoreicorticis]MCO7126926.1 YfhO family protein [Sporolactobacillus shoreicorticis]
MVMRSVFMKKIIHSNYMKVFLLCLVTSGMMFLPSIIANKGLFTLVGDFNYQQIPFNMLSNHAIKSGDWFWNWSTDLGSNFIASYSFYTLGSPFFWLSLLFPSSFFPYVIGPMFLLKYCAAGMTAYGYMRRYVSDSRYAMIGALLYAFSGFSTVNLMFNHFHDVVAFFPMLLAGLDRLMLDRKKGWFAAAVALNAFLNFFFFIGEVIFLILYYVLRYVAEDWKLYLRRLPRIVWEGLLGIGMASLLFVPAILFTLQNPRLDSFLYGPNALAYTGSRYLQLVKSFLMPADLMPHQSAIFPSDFSSSSAYLPLFGPVLMIALMLGRRTWMRRVMLGCLTMAGVPLLNSLFYILNASYYARWFYMPVLIMALMSAVALEQRNTLPVKKSLLISASLLAVLAAFLLFYPWSQTQRNAVYHYDQFLFYLIAAAAGLITVYYLVWRFRGARHWHASALALTVIFCAGLGLFNIFATHSIYDYQDGKAIQDTVVKTGKELKRRLPKTEDYRIGISDDGWNLAMVADLPTVNSFTSMVNGSIFEFYKSIGSPRGVKTIIPEDAYALKPLLSERFFVNTVKMEGNPLYTNFYNGTGMVYVYENKDALPIGFTYDYYVTQSQFQHITDDYKPQVMLRAVVIKDSDVPKVKNYLVPLPESEMFTTTKTEYRQDLQERAKESSTSFRRDRFGFSADIRANTDKFAFFSVPYDKGWSAKVNGISVSIIDADGMMIVPVSDGENHIRFNYRTPGLASGVVIALFSVAAYTVYLSSERLFYRRRSRPSLNE